ncbi:MAG: T9SS type A sorting domain-containing protein [Chitinophagales bacterium]
MKIFLLLFSMLFLPLIAPCQIVSEIASEYHDGQVFITWKNIVGVDTGFYYVYKNSVPVSEANIQASAYLGRVPFNFSYDYRFSYALADSNHYFLLINDTPYTVLDTTQNLFVMNCTQEGAQDFFAVRCNYNNPDVNWHIIADSNATSQSVTEHLDPIKCYFQKGGIIFPGAKSDETMDTYIHYGGNVAVGDYPAMVNEGCIPFHFGIIKTGLIGGNNGCFLKFHGGNGNFINNAITAHMNNTWKISFDDWIPAYNLDSTGNNTRWFGYNEYLDIYKIDKSAPSPDSGVIRAYTYYRTKWELSWIKKTWPNTLDTSREYLVGSSQGCAAVLVHSMVDPLIYSSGNLSDTRFNISAPDDANPSCKYNESGSARKEVRLFWGNEDSTNLYTDIPVAPGSNQFFRIYDLTNMNFMFHFRRNTSLPFLEAVNGKLDMNTCWQEKISVYDSVQSTHAGGIYQWDLRSHGGGQSNAWPNLSIPDMQRFSILISYPAFSYTSLDQDPGDANVVDSPYYNGADIGALHRNLDWIDSSIVDSSYLWQIQLYCYQNVLNDSSLIPAVLPEFATSEVTIRRAQHFKDFPVNTKLCWLNFYHGELIQSGTVIQQADDTVLAPITISKVKVFPDGNILRVMLCDSLQPTGMLIPQNLFGEQGYGAIISGDELPVFSHTMETLNYSVQLTDMMGDPVASVVPDDTKTREFILPNLEKGIYFMKVKNAAVSSVGKLIKI